LLPSSLDVKKSTMLACCCKTICQGCAHANKLREMEQSLDHKCAFCRHRLPETEAEAYKNVLKRAQANDPVALRQMGTIRHDGGDIGGAFEYWTKAAALCDATAHYGLSRMYHNGDGVQKDIKKKIYHAEKAAISGHPMARHYLGCHEANSDRIERAVKHFIIAANLGCDNSLKNLREYYERGLVTKENFAAALRAHQAAVQATRSPQREAAASYANGQEQM
jgi:hypothetical protein